MDDNKFWLCVWSMGAAVFLSILTLICASHWHDNDLRAEIISKAADPMMAVCAYEADDTVSNSRVPYCTIYLTKGK